MNQEVSLIPLHPVMQKFIASILQTINEKDFKKIAEKSVIHADMVPNVPQKALEISAKKAIESPKPLPTPTIERKPLPPQPPRMVARPVQPRPLPPRPPRPVPHMMPPQKTPTSTAPISAQKGPIDIKGEYGKISPLLNDPSVSTIECSGKDKELMIIRAGQRQKTKISLSEKEIKEILEHIADVAHIPLIEGVFRASVKGMSISAVISEIIGSKFVIKKATAYSLVE